MSKAGAPGTFLTARLRLTLALADARALVLVLVLTFLPAGKAARVRVRGLDLPAEARRAGARLTAVLTLFFKGDFLGLILISD